MAVSARLKMASAVAQLGAHVLWDRLTKPMPTDIREIPPCVEAITREWLSAALCARHPGAEVVSFALGAANHATTSQHKMNVTYNEAGRRAGLPALLFIKSTPHFTSRLATMSGSSITEERFYNRIRRGLDIEAPVAYYAAANPRSGRSMVIFEDMALTRGCIFTNATVYIDREKAEDMLSLLATLHGQFWNSPRLDREFTWLRTSENFQTQCNQMIDFKSRSHIGIDRAQTLIPESLLARKAEIWPAAMKSLAINVRAPLTLLHYDVHIGNWYMTGEGRMGLGDWQTIVKGNWACDVAYALSSALTVADRRTWERELLRSYLDRLNAAGVREVPSFDHAWLAYRQQLFHGFIFWLYVMGAGAMQAHMQPDAFSTVSVERFAHAIADLEALASVNAA